MPDQSLKLLFIINPASGSNDTDWQKEIDNYFARLPHHITYYQLPQQPDLAKLKEVIRSGAANRVIAAGGDGTVKLVAEALLGTQIPMAILPAGSANGMATELGIPTTPSLALDIVVNGAGKKIHLVKVNNELCIHLSDIGFNAFVIKKFEAENTRGMWGYVKAAWKVLWNHAYMKVAIMIDGRYIQREAAMVVIANATQYGNKVKINPEGNIEDDLFEVVIIKKISMAEIFKMRFTHGAFHPAKTELLQTRSLKIDSHQKVHFQVDGEYLGKVNTVQANIIPHALEIITPAE
ncbi:lipid kinase, YegS/Rv2252/BmrU family [Chitinophaga rupis]|uniref:Lipid kinase, YegS/Rv2252/BmrU family n=1 Tax=Chitinophaga rupis TaxID=573321 RepID=A0A1H7QWX1_9BACT|nr:diacylglycerol kinase family protein [Chitinophaga rupis]SEL52228.1 lipid kinase, YegS/Rv2252/BmrU family [Chitinophaga rupis]